MFKRKRHYQNAASLEWVEIKVRGEDIVPRYWSYCPCGSAVLGSQLNPAQIDDFKLEDKSIIHIPLEYFPDETQETIALILNTLGKPQ